MLKIFKWVFIAVLFVILLLLGCLGDKNNALSVKSAEQKKQEAIDYPAWILDPSVGGCLGAVGTAKEQENAARSQQWVAEKVAMAELSRQFEILVESICRSKKTGHFSDDLLVKYEQELDCVSMQKSEHLFSVYSHDPVIKDRWIDPDNGDLYVWAVLPVSD